MIPYEELCEALARWRSRQGLENGPSARPVASRSTGEVAAQPAAAPHAPAGSSPRSDPGHDIDSVLLFEDEQ